ncbi:FAD binding domain-containing protein [Synergistes jonesii]|uniref:FAD-binding PCMH-type domain-containing protein n=1 Tax=Synergistes jonesii TaxID=2754 RepID=A0A073IRF3_9BACT|nr:FAD binding domain-containing protein [Synergistes jonesii]KEJ92026.1 hypothetical protein EH55_06490 [Synergistes jonesii]OFB61970.1 hypothetical protein JS73_08590 [Synergistes jonesii]OFB62575.1 hypothetical protein JS79_09055 [Synergistes jonesii]OFB64264.1 hypothetical protein JS72_04870 [Synergistes jonesii]OFB67411.1 hypothetical protein JS78_08600 [Synergistes jonesii]
MSFKYLAPSSLEEVFEALKQNKGAKLYAGGSDVLLQLRAHTIEPDCLVSLAKVEGLDFIRVSEDGARIGSMTTLRAVEDTKIIKDNFTTLSEAARNVASQKLRNRATIGGNLCQKVKCPYFNQSHINLFMRQSLEPCFKRGGKVCHAVRYGDDLLHTITGKSYCKAPLPSDMAMALCALGASVVLQSPAGSIEIMVKDFYRVDAEPQIKSDMVLTEIKIPGRRHFSAYKTYKPGPGVFALVSASADVVPAEDGRACAKAQICLGGVAQTPYMAEESVRFLEGGVMSPERIEAASKMLFKDVNITNDDVLFKVAKARDLFRKAVALAWNRTLEGAKS